MDRRSFLKRGLFGGAILLVAGTAGLALRPGKGAPRPMRHLAVVDEKAFPILVAVAARVLEGTQADPIVVAHAIDDALRRTTAEGRRDFSRVLFLFESALPGLLLRGSPTPFTRMSPEEQDRALLAWRDSRFVLLRGAYHAMRRLSFAGFYGSPAAWRHLGYAGPRIVKAEPPPITARGPLSPPFDPSTGASQ